METQKAQVGVPAKAGRKLSWLDVLFEDESLSPTAKNVAWRLVRHHNDETGLCFPKQATLAKGIGRKIRVVNNAIRELKESGWIEVKQHRDGAHYVLVLDRAEAVEAGVLRGVPRVSYSRSRVAGTRDPACLVREIPRTEPPTLTPQETTHPTPALVAVAIEPETGDPVIAQTIMPDRSVNALPTPANDDLPATGGRVFSGWMIPAETIRQWTDAFTDINLNAELVRRAPWFVAEVPEKRRLGALASKLHKVNEEARQVRITRQENRQADAKAGVERDLCGRIIGAPKKSRFQW